MPFIFWSAILHCTVVREVNGKSQEGHTIDKIGAKMHYTDSTIKSKQKKCNFKSRSILWQSGANRRQTSLCRSN